ncbi:MAG: TrkH family potassium uptake protein, partial [Ruminococcaceae bacterium]|nr:TrkH family potassium uptake protein [Oscillospiraceae bacterium]
LPFFFSGTIPHYVDAFFETVSGFTTTGSSILTEVEHLGKGMLWWRSFSHWVGGMGVLVFFLAIIPVSGSGGFSLHILRAESTGPAVGKSTPKMRETAGALYIIYIGLTVLDFIFLLIGKMKVFDAACIAFGTAGTGGFTVLNTGFATYTPFAINVTTVFMLLFGVNFSIYFMLLFKRVWSALKNEELICYVVIVICSTLFFAVNIYQKTAQTMQLNETIMHSAFQVGALITTTGYATADFAQWPAFSQAVALVLMMIGACAGSTGGGMKIARVMLLFKSLKRNVHKLNKPSEIRVVKFNRQKVSEQTVSNVNAYLAAYVILIIVSFLIVSLDKANYSVTSNLSAVISTFNNIGPALDQIGPMSNYSGYSALSKIVFSFDMLFGRLEIFPILMLLLPHTYKKH